MNLRMATPLVLLICTLALAGSAPAGARVAGDAHLMPAHPRLIERVGNREVARLHRAQYTPEMRRDLNLDRPTTKSAAVLGTGTPLIVLWDFSDHTADLASHPASAYEAMLFSTGTYPTGSLNDFYLEASFGNFGVGGQLIGWQTAGNTYASYANANGSQDPNTARVMIQDMIAQLDATINFADYDSDLDGLVDGLFFVHAGAGQEESGDPADIWSHSWSFGGGLPTNDGVSIDRYSVEPEEFSDGSQITVGVFAHEYGHMIGLPDLYDTDYSSAGIGQWGLMSGGSWTHRPGDQPGSSPAALTAWSKIQLGWLTPTEFVGDAAGLVLPPANTNPVAFKFHKAGDAGGDEYFLVENRRRLGFDEGLLGRQIDLGLPDPEGMIIYHVDESMSGNATDAHRLLDVVDASPWFGDNGDYHENLNAPTADYSRVSGYNRGDNGDLWPGFTSFSADSTDWSGVRDRATFDSNSIPATATYDCSATGLALTNIALSGVDVVFDLTLAAVAPQQPVLARANEWNFERDAADWQFCNSYAHLDQTQNQNCGGNQGLWFGSNGWDNCSGAGYGNSWNDHATVTVGVNVASGPQVQINHKFELEPGYDYAYLEVRPAGINGAIWTTLAAYTGFSSCVTNNHTIPASVLAAGDPDGNGTAAVEVRLRLATDGVWSAQDGSFCGLGWWVDDFLVTQMYAAGVELPGATLGVALSNPVPNPFNPATALAYTVPTGAGSVSLVIYDQRGRQVRTLAVEADSGRHEIIWNGRNDQGGAVASGLYFARFQVDEVVEIRKMALIK
ncbi:MAG: M6 family metalloprotease domain-containing protein [Candidatus Krumholzibacteria bacterium]|nr:M6 family metalloprotease domain-containing protein [Candidatus Krumholzibacteria bacterium]